MDPLKYLTNCTIYSTISQEQDEAAWLAARTKGIGGSDIGPICGISPFTSARQVYLSKTGQYSDAMTPGHAARERMHFGHVLEPIVADEYARQTGCKLLNANVTLQHKDYPWALANTDRFIVDDEDVPVGVLECKTTSEYGKDDWEEGEILLTYIYQLQWYMWVTGLRRGAFACLVGGNKFFYYDVQYDGALVNDVLIPAAKHFWEENLLKLVEPEMQAADTDFVNGIYKEVVKGSEISFAEDVVNELAGTVVTCKAKIKELEGIMEEAQNRIKDRLQSAEIGHTADYIIKWSPRVQNRIDSDAVRNNYPEIVPHVTKRIEFRAMTVREVK